MFTRDCEDGPQNNILPLLLRSKWISLIDMFRFDLLFNGEEDADSRNQKL
jgi:hypothetical protein